MSIFETDWRTTSILLIGSAEFGGWDVEVWSVVVEEAIGVEIVQD